MSNVLLLTSTAESAAEILPSLSLLDHAVRLAPASADHVLNLAAAGSGPADGARVDAVLVDARRDLVRMRQLLGQLSGIGKPMLAIVGEGGWAAVTADWGVDDVILSTAGPGEVEARIRLAIGRAGRPAAGPAEEVRSGELVIDEATYSARIRGTALDLTFKEFELLKFLAQHPRRVFTRSQLLQEVWGYDYFGGTRTVDVHVRRLRAKLGTDNEALIGTVRNVGYKFVPARAESRQPGTGSGLRSHQADGGTGQAVGRGNQSRGSGSQSGGSGSQSDSETAQADSETGQADSETAQAVGRGGQAGSGGSQSDGRGGQPGYRAEGRDSDDGVRT